MIGKREEAFQALDATVAGVVKDGAMKLLEAGGVTAYSSGLDTLIHTALVKLSYLNEPGLHEMLKTIIKHCELILLLDGDDE